MKIYADENMPLVSEFFQSLGEVVRFDGRKVSAEQLVDADVLLVRSITKVDASLLADNKRLRFVGTATIGMDHIDQPYLAKRGIPFYSAPGCNAQSVVEYVLSSIWVLTERYQWQLADKTVGVVGCGNIGRRLVHTLQLLGIKVLQCDPLRAQLEPEFEHTDFASLCLNADIISLHTPLIKKGPLQTHHLINSEVLQRLSASCALINASRGAVIDNQALLIAQQQQRRPLVLDVWESEPDILTPLLAFTDIATAHIAGHSVEGKARGTEMLYQQLCQQWQLPVEHKLQHFMPAAALQQLHISSVFGLPDVQNVSRMIYDVRRDDALLRFHLAEKGFDWLRKSYPPRREFSSLTVTGAGAALAQQLGFSGQ
ncbi:4-phosphoerythronate dehydrogenase [Arsukibacterium sp.]|uniref:4-phosphoerythronate dehydrogenase n=1 Tax=Arsukibacterium sp. TaxID=1977258 RepID=UPI002FDA4839